MRRLLALIPALLMVVLVVMTGYLAFNYLGAVKSSRALVGHSRDVIEAGQTLFSLVQEAEASQRGYLLTRDETYLRPFGEAVADTPIWQDRLKRLTEGDDTGQRQTVARLNAAIDARMAEMSQTVALARDGRAQDAQEILFADRGRMLMAEARRELNGLLDSEADLLEARTKQARAQVDRGFVTALVLGALSLAGLGAALVTGALTNRRLRQEIAKRESAVAAQRAGDALHRALFDNAADYFYVLDVLPDGRFSVGDVNRAFASVMRVRPEKVRGRTIGELMPKDAAEAMEAHYRRVCSGHMPVVTRDTLPFPDGARIWETILSPVRDEGDTVRRIVGASRDITERVEAEEQLRRTQRLEVIGQLTGGVAHDFNNLLQVIRGNLELMEPGLADDPRMSRRLLNALHGAERAGQLTRQLLAFARRQPLEPKVVDLGRLVGDMDDLLRRTLGERIEVETVVGAGLWKTIADPAQVESALLNLAINARDAMPDGGRLTIEVSNAAIDDAYARTVGDIEAGQYVLLAVSDTGEGMEQATLERVFEPFFTTKSDGRGSGLGMSMVYGFVKQSNGHVQLYSERGQGTTAKIYLPRTRREEEAPEAVARAASDGLGQLILVVEDEELVRAAAVSMLEDFGYRCLEAGDAEAALETVKREPAIDLVFSDVVMPGPLKTRDMAEQIKALRPGLPILFTSGYTANAIVHHGRLDDGVHLLSKPYARNELGLRVAGLLGTAG